MVFQSEKRTSIGVGVGVGVGVRVGVGVGLYENHPDTNATSMADNAEMVATQIVVFAAPEICFFLAGLGICLSATAHSLSKAALICFACEYPRALKRRICFT